MSIYPVPDIEELKKINLSFEVTQELIDSIRSMHYEKALSKSDIDKVLTIDTGENQFILKVLGYPHWDAYNSNFPLLVQKVQLGTFMSTMQDSLSIIMNDELLPGLSDQLENISKNIQNLANKIGLIEKALESLETDVLDSFAAPLPSSAPEARSPSERFAQAVTASNSAPQARYSAHFPSRAMSPDYSGW